ncbi:MAG: 1-acyl-sn-glycerol-3-phosphate acyltransferase [Gorillibacterium sp.]|nr:1-acyl-sn-glycerol-3-phosphate acyltransferase [Gorillibacterium sp.]
MRFYRFTRALLRVLYRLFFRLEAKGKENVPDFGPVVLCANHVSYFDPIAVGIPLKRKVHFMAKEELFSNTFLRKLLLLLGAFPVKRGGISKESIRHSIELLRNGNVMGIYPEGTTKGENGMGKKGAAMLALRSKAVVIPVAVVGSFKLFKKVHIQYGPPVDIREFADGGSENLEAATEKIMDVIREMVTSHKLLGKN